MYALHNGTELWRYASHISTQHPPPLLVANGMVYVGAQDGGLDALRASDGSLLWHYTLYTPLSMRPEAGLGVVFVQPENATALDDLYVLKTSDGSLLWRMQIGEIVLAIVDDIVYVKVPTGGVDALRASNGSLLWHHFITA